MVRLGAAAGGLLLLLACGGTAPDRRSADTGISDPQAIPVSFASGPIGTACLVHDRPNATRARCGCIQAVADRTLTQQQQKRSVVYFSDPGLLQDVRQSDAPGNARFWEAWKNFAETAETVCRGL
ncbi:hypothetical protein KX928_04895 [Roseobacter sp. YSTF-M11]|uniref:Arginine transporter n=1 Tax=Roseobacter insulae TaxID=2859783 RepID=A0A9X1FSY3_9RHOB|nr:hypothetical protein [Roseobacter insulae]MBW4707118.1 hypothetical protein [Roseobacter insulae]